MSQVIGNGVSGDRKHLMPVIVEGCLKPVL
jgi:hypothetical protein